MDSEALADSEAVSQPSLTPTLCHVRVHATPHNAAQLASIPLEYRGKTDGFCENMDRLVENDIKEFHWHLSKSESQEILESLFPDSVLFQSKHSSLNMLNILQRLRDKDKKLYGATGEGVERWTHYPKTAAARVNMGTSTTRTPTGDTAEASMAKFLNKVLEAVEGITGEQTNRRWHPHGSTNPFGGSFLQRKPDLVLSPDGTELDWRDVLVFGEMKNTNCSKTLKTSFTEIAGKTSVLLYAQDGRHAAPSLRILGSSISLTFFDQGGSLETYPIDVHADPEMFLCIVVGLAKASFSQLGFDVSLLDETGSKRVLVAWKGGGDVTEVMIDSLLFISDIMHRRGTTVWWGLMDDLENNSHSSNHRWPRTRTGVVIKDSWIDPLRRYTEGTILKLLNAAGVAAHRDTLKKAGILHHDISLFNLLLVRSAESEEHLEFLDGLPKGTRDLLRQKIEKFVSHRGLLGDWGYAVPINATTSQPATGLPTPDLDSNPFANDTLLTSSKYSEDVVPAAKVSRNGQEHTIRYTSVSHLGWDHNIKLHMAGDPLDFAWPTVDTNPLYRTGTWSWMAVELVAAGPKKPVIHRPVHDLESMFYVLVGICVLLGWPHNVKVEENLKCFDTFFNSCKPSTRKTSTIQSNFGWGSDILPNISPYFRPLIPLLNKLRAKIILPMDFVDGRFLMRGDEITHDVMVDALLEALCALDDNGWAQVTPPPKPSNEQLERTFVWVENSTNIPSDSDPNSGFIWLPSCSSRRPFSTTKPDPPPHAKRPQTTLAPPPGRDWYSYTN
ncbi:hypothetical protein HD554DRAFT_2037832 [Boletus coccyginus]|nr:hypothetical protein HD554DRAFT_2037832 [Boletus coccyginus]